MIIKIVNFLKTDSVGIALASSRANDLGEEIIISDAFLLSLQD